VQKKTPGYERKFDYRNSRVWGSNSIVDILNSILRLEAMTVILASYASVPQPMVHSVFSACNYIPLFDEDTPLSGPLWISKAVFQFLLPVSRNPGSTVFPQFYYTPVTKLLLLWKG
jgi:hypothetical protein